jgi:hypothetical protein
MAVRRVVCPKCASSRKRIVEEYEPDTHDMNMRVRLVCENPLCKHEWDAKVMSNRTREKALKGRLRV